MAYPPSPAEFTDLQLAALPEASTVGRSSRSSSHAVAHSAAALPPRAPSAAAAASRPPPASAALPGSGRLTSTEVPAYFAGASVTSTRPILSDASSVGTTVPIKLGTMRDVQAAATTVCTAGLPTSVAVPPATLALGGSASNIDLSEELCKRIEALQQKNRHMQASHEAALLRARSGSKPRLNGSRLGAAGSSQSSLGGLAGARTRSLGSLARSVPQSAIMSPAMRTSNTASVASSPASSRLGDKLNSRKQRAESLALRLREFHELIRQYENPRAAPSAQQRARSASQISAASPPSHPQGQAESQDSMALATLHNTATARQLTEQATQAKAALAQQQAAHQEEVLRLEEALLAQNVQREQELQARLEELEMEWEQVEEAEARVRARAAEVWSAAINSRFDRASASGDSFLRNAPSVRSSPGLIASGAEQVAIAQAGPEGDSSLPLSSSRLPPPHPSPARPLPAMPHSSSTRPFPAAWAQSSSLQQLGASGSGARGCQDEWQVPADLPPVYEAAIAIILQHGWEMLHGGENAGPAWTALHWAASEGRPDVCDLLLQAGADAGLRDELGKTALDYALENGQMATAEILTAIPASTRMLRFSQRDVGDLWESPWPSRQSGKCGSPQAEGRARAAALPMALAGPAPWMRDEQCV